jgi:hypothetical protein
MHLDPGAPSECGDRRASIAAKFGWFVPQARACGREFLLLDRLQAFD